MPAEATVVSRNPDLDLQKLVRLYKSDQSNDLETYEKILAIESRSGISVGTSLPPDTVETYALVLRYRVHSGKLQLDRLMAAAHLGYEPARLAALEWEYIGYGQRKYDWSNRSQRVGLIRLLRDKRLIVSYAADCARRHITNEMMDRDRLGSFRDCVIEARRWVRSPTNTNKIRARLALRRALNSGDYFVIGTRDSKALIGCAYAASIEKLSAVCNAASDSAMWIQGDYYQVNTEPYPIDQPWVIHRLCLYLLDEIVLPDIIDQSDSNRRNSSYGHTFQRRIYRGQ